MFVTKAYPRIIFVLTPLMYSVQYSTVEYITVHYSTVQYPQLFMT